ncbi:hypothetical protein [Amycolatopsis sp. lyj-346]|uniref:hypothetical protein n=1 Tax=Amycolatopsis sp. lyj-346 TaxID=2789289 RepID=UPI0039787EEF
MGPSKATYAPAAVSPISQCHVPLCSICQASAHESSCATTSPVGSRSPVDQVLREVTARRPRGGWWWTTGSIAARPASRSGMRRHRDSAAQSESASRTSNPVTPSPVSPRNAPVTAEVTASTTTSPPPSTASSVQVRTAATPGVASNTLVTTRPVTASNCSIRSAESSRRCAR